VLLHVVDAARPVDLAVDGAGGNFGAGVVNDVAGIARVCSVWRGGACCVNNFDYLRAA
jgi:hypothetical protein